MSLITINITIEKNEDGFWAYAENEKGLVGGGETVAACKQDILDCIGTLSSLDSDNRFPYHPGEYQLTFKFDTASPLSF